MASDARREPAPDGPRVTVAIPTWNRAGYLRDALASVLTQTFADIEVLVSDNGSTDETAEVVASFGDPRVRHLRLPENIGLLPNLARALHLGSAPYVTVFGDDDLMAPRNLEVKVALLDAHPAAAFVHSSTTIIDGDGAVTIPDVTYGAPCDPVEPGRTFIARTMVGGNRVGLSAAVVRRAVLGDDGFDERDGPACDLALWMRLALRGEVLHAPEPLVSIRQHAAAASVAVGGVSFADGHYVDRGRVLDALRVREEFLDRFGDQVPDARALRRRARRAARNSLVRDVRRSGRSGREQVAALARLATSDPGVLATTEAVELLVERVAGERGARTVDGLRRRARPTV